MTDNKINELLAILDEHEINLDIDSEELSMLKDDLVDNIKQNSDKSEIVSTLLSSIADLREETINECETIREYSYDEITPMNYNCPKKKR